MHIHEWHIVISGFLQRQGNLNGMDKIWDIAEMRSKSRPDARAMLYPWHCDVADIAELINRKRDPDTMPVVNLYGYSWGGMTCANLAEELRDREIDVRTMVLSDAVYRHWYKLGQWRALVPCSRIYIPDNVKRVIHFRQRENLPGGHTLVAKNSGMTDIEPVRWLTAKHQHMDDSITFRLACQRAIEGTIA